MNETIQKAREAKAWNCDEWPEWLHAVVDKTCEVADRLDMSSEQAHAYAALAALDAETEVKVLDWQVFCSNSGNCEAKTPFGKYVIQSDARGGWYLYPMNQETPGVCHSTLDGAKAAAQADFERRIRSVLVPPKARS